MRYSKSERRECLGRMGSQSQPPGLTAMVLSKRFKKKYLKITIGLHGLPCTCWRQGSLETNVKKRWKDQSEKLSV